MESKLDIKKEQEKIVVYDKSVYNTPQDFMTLYNTFKMSLDMLEEREKQSYDAIKKMGEEKVIMKGRFDSIVKFMKKNHIPIPKEETK